MSQDDIVESEDNEVIDAEAELEEDDTSFGTYDDAEAESTPEEADTEVEEDAEPEESQDDPDSDGEDTAPEQSDEPEETQESEEEPQQDKTKEELAQEAYRRREAERQLREERQRQEQQNLERYLQEAEDDEVEYARRQNEIAQYQIQQERQALTQERLQVGMEQAVKSIDLFQTGTPEQKEALASRLDTFEALYVVKDQNGKPVQVNADVYQFLQNEAESIKRLSGIGARQQVKSKAKEKARTLTKPVRTPKAPKPDPDLDGFDEEANRW